MLKHGIFALFFVLASCATVEKIQSQRSPSANSQTVTLISDTSHDAYELIQNSFGPTPETPDCGHSGFGHHITQAEDLELGKSVFVFHIHVKQDNDRCVKFDRQRTEIKTMGDLSSPDILKGFLGDTVVLRWKFKIPLSFKTAYSFTHLHQLKAYDGDSDMPLITLTARKGNPDVLQIIHIDSTGRTTVLSADTILSELLGQWVEVYEKVTYGHDGKYSVAVKRLSDNKPVTSFAFQHLDMWRNDTTVVRPKWGIYRSLQYPEQLSDENIRFDQFCVTKAPGDCL